MSDDILNMLRVGGLQKPSSDRVIEHIEALREENRVLTNTIKMHQEGVKTLGGINANLHAENALLRAALKPFAELWSISLIAFGTDAPDDYTFRQSVSCGIVRAAAAALKETGDE